MALESVAQRICEERGFTFVGKVGEGAFKETYHVTGTDDEDLALKVFRANMSAARTEREIDAMQRCSHPNIAHLLAVADLRVDAHTHTYTVEEFLAGGTLASRIEAFGPPSNVQVLSLAAQLVEAISHIASRDLVHRDIKPENVLFRDDGFEPVVVDFGIVRDLGRSPLTRTWLLRGPGTPFFAAPEQLNNERDLIDWRTDQFSLGLTLFVSRWGVHPYDQGALRPDEIVSAVAERQPVSPAAVELAEDEGLSVLVRMVNPWPVRRFRRPVDLKAAIDYALKAFG